MIASHKCQECGTEVPSGSPGGLCGRCLLTLALKQNQELTESGSGQTEAESCAAAREELERLKPAALAIQEGLNKEYSSIVTEQPGDKIGRYKMLHQIGGGGFGVVYVAEQEAPVKRRVALKILKLGMDTREVIARFEVERQALALMEHPNIAKVLDAGATETGRPYFVMELVHGTKITEYCDENSLSARQRLELFIQVCRGHAFRPQGITDGWSRKNAENNPRTGAGTTVKPV